MGSLVKFITNLIVFVILIGAAYIAGLMFQLLPLSMTPKELFTDQYPGFKAKLTQDVAANGMTSGIEKILLTFLNNVEEAYTPTPKPVPAPAVPAAPMQPAAAPATTMQPGVAAPQMPATPAVQPVTAPGQTPAVTPAATPVPAGTAAPTAPQTQPTDPVAKSKQVVQQYQNSIDNEKKAIDSY